LVITVQSIHETRSEKHQVKLLIMFVLQEAKNVRVKVEVSP